MIEGAGNALIDNLHKPMNDIIMSPGLGII